MTPAQIAEAERLAAEWQPNPAECEAYEVAGEKLKGACFDRAYRAISACQQCVVLPQWR